MGFIVVEELYNDKKQKLDAMSDFIKMVNDMVSHKCGDRICVPNKALELECLECGYVASAPTTETKSKRGKSVAEWAENMLLRKGYEVVREDDEIIASKPGKEVINFVVKTPTGTKAILGEHGEIRIATSVVQQGSRITLEIKKCSSQ